MKSISNTSSGVKISWNAVSKAHGYLVYRKTAETGWKRIQMTNSDSVLNYTDKTAEAGKTYTYTVKAYVKKNENHYYGSYDTTGKTILRLTQPSVSISNKTGGVKISWKQISGANGYRVYRKTGTASWTKIGTITSKSTVSYTDKTAEAGKLYAYTVRATGKAGDATVLSSFSSAGKKIIRLAEPTISLSKSKSGIKISWKKVTGATGYYVYRKNTNGKWAKIQTITSKSKVSYTDTSVKTGKSYTYTVKAYCIKDDVTYTSSYLSAGKTIKR